MAFAEHQDAHLLAPHKHIKYVHPVKRIHRPEDVSKWQQSEAHHKLVSFILFLNDSVKGKKVSDPYPVSPIIDKLIALLDTLDKWVDEIPPIQQPMRFGNKAFRLWFAKVNENAAHLVRDILPHETQEAAIEIAPFLVESIGNQTRIDYGTGHEASFAAFLAALALVNAVAETDGTALVLRVFDRYLKLMRKVQKTYALEPAGSHGVWGLDDYQFLPFVWGSSQLLDNKDEIQPAHYLEPAALAKHEDYIFLGAIKFILEMKRGPFHEHSPILYDITGVPTWQKANQGLVRMYNVEVLSKFPVIQHFLFGTLFPANWESHSSVETK
eukprot:Opistho-2@60428